MSPVERLGLLGAAYVVLVGLLWLAGRSITRRAERRQAARLDRSRPAVDEHLADRAIDIPPFDPVPAWIVGSTAGEHIGVPVEPCGWCGQVLPSDHRTRGMCTGAAR